MRLRVSKMLGQQGKNIVFTAGGSHCAKLSFLFVFIKNNRNFYPGANEGDLEGAPKSAQRSGPPLVGADAPLREGRPKAATLRREGVDATPLPAGIAFSLDCPLCSKPAFLTVVTKNFRNFPDSDTRPK